MSYKFNPFTGNFDDFNGPDGKFSSVNVEGDISLDDGGTYTTTLQTITPTAARTISFPDATGTVALVGGSSGQLLWNNAGAVAGASTLTYDGSILTTSGRFINSYNATASSPAKAFTGTWFTGGTATTTKPQVLIEPTGTTSTAWSTAGTALGVNASSGFAGNLLDLQVNGTSQFKVSNIGSVSSLTYNAIDIGGNIWAKLIGASGDALQLTNSSTIGWCAGYAGNTPDLRLARDTSNTLAQRNGTNAQAFRLYNTYTDSSNYERHTNSWSGNVLNIANEAAGTGTLRSIAFSANAAASTPPVTFTGTWFTGGTATTTKPQVLIEPTGTTSTAWSTSGTGLGVNAASGFVGNLLDLQLNGTSNFSVTRQGTINWNGVLGTTATELTLAIGGANRFRFFDTRLLFRAPDVTHFGWATDGGFATVKTAIWDEGTGILAQRNGTAAQTFRCYNTWTSSTNYELGKLEWSSNVFRIGTEKGSGGGTAQAVEVHTDSISRLAIDTTGSVRVVTGLTVATLPSSPTVGMIARVTNALAPAMGTTVAGGGAAAALCWYNGASWSVIGI